MKLAWATWMSTKESGHQFNELNAYERAVEREEEKVNSSSSKSSDELEDEASDLYRQHSHQQSMEGG